MNLILNILFDWLQLGLEALKFLSPYIVIGVTWLAVQLSGIVKKLPGIFVVIISGLVGALLQLLNTVIVQPELNPLYAIGLGFAAVFFSQLLKQIQSEKISEDRAKILESNQG